MLLLEIKTSIRKLLFVLLTVSPT